MHGVTTKIKIKKKTAWLYLLFGSYSSTHVMKELYYVLFSFKMHSVYFEITKFSVKLISL